jgi:hypothetical protein
MYLLPYAYSVDGLDVRDIIVSSFLVSEPTGVASNKEKLSLCLSTIQFIFMTKYQRSLILDTRCTGVIIHMLQWPLTNSTEYRLSFEARLSVTQLVKKFPALHETTFH